MGFFSKKNPTKTKILFPLNALLRDTGTTTLHANILMLHQVILTFYQFLLYALFVADRY